MKAMIIVLLTLVSITATAGQTCTISADGKTIVCQDDRERYM